MPIANPIKELKQLKSIIEDKGNLDAYLKSLNTESLERLTKELQLPIDEIILRISGKDFQTLISKACVPMHVEKIITTSKKERAGSIIKGFLSVAIGTFSTLIGAVNVLPLLIVSGGLVIGFSMLRGILEQHALNKRNKKIFFEAKLDNLAIAAFQELNFRKYFTTLEQAKKLLSCSSESASSQKLDEIVNRLEERLKQQSDVSTNDSLRNTLEELKKTLQYINLENLLQNKVTLNNKNRKSKINLISHEELTFKKWRRLSQNSLIKRVTDEAAVKLTETFMIMGFSLTIIKVTGITGSIAAFLTGPVGIAAVACFALVTGLIIGGITLYNLFREEKRKYEMDHVMKRALRSENKISNKLDTIQTHLRELESEIKNLQAPPAQQPVHKSDINDIQFTLQSALTDINKKLDVVTSQLTEVQKDGLTNTKDTSISSNYATTTNRYAFLKPVDDSVNVVTPADEHAKGDHYQPSNAVSAVKVVS